MRCDWNMCDLCELQQFRLINWCEWFSLWDRIESICRNREPNARHGTGSQLLYIFDGYSAAVWSICRAYRLKSQRCERERVRAHDRDRESKQKWRWRGQMRTMTQGDAIISPPPHLSHSFSFSLFASDFIFTFFVFISYSSGTIAVAVDSAATASSPS